jgi:hypothetical protein
MKIRSLLALVGLAISFALPAFAQQKEPSLSDQDGGHVLPANAHPQGYLTGTNDTKSGSL